MTKLLKNMPRVGDSFVFGLNQYPVMGYAADTNSLMYAKTYIDKDAPLETSIKGLVTLDTGHFTYWVSKTRLIKSPLRFNVSFRWYNCNHNFSTHARSVLKARQNVMHRIGVELCNTAPNKLGVHINKAKASLSEIMGSTFQPTFLNVELCLRY